MESDRQDGSLARDGDPPVDFDRDFAASQGLMRFDDIAEIDPAQVYLWEIRTNPHFNLFKYKQYYKAARKALSEAARRPNEPTLFDLITGGKPIKLKVNAKLNLLLNILERLSYLIFASCIYSLVLVVAVAGGLATLALTIYMYAFVYASPIILLGYSARNFSSKLTYGICGALVIYIILLYISTTIQTVSLKAKSFPGSQVSTLRTHSLIRAGCFALLSFVYAFVISADLPLIRDQFSGDTSSLLSWGWFFVDRTVNYILFNVPNRLLGDLSRIRPSGEYSNMIIGIYRLIIILGFANALKLAVQIVFVPIRECFIGTSTELMSYCGDHREYFFKIIDEIVK